MVPFMHRYAAQTYALMRIVTGFLFLWHGTQKLFSVPMPPPETSSGWPRIACTSSWDMPASSLP